MFAALRGDAAVRRVIGNGAWLFAANGASGALLAVKGLIVARALGVAGFGLVGLVITFVTVLGRLTSFRMNEFVIQYLSRSEAAGRTDQGAVVRFSLGVEAAAAALAYGVVWLAAPLGARLVLRDPAGAELIRLYATVILAGAISETSNGVLQMYGRFRTCSLVATAGAAVSLAATVVALALGSGIRGVIGALVAGALVAGGGASFAALREVRRHLGPRWWATSFDAFAGRWRSVIAFVFSTNASSTLTLITKDADLLWLGLLRGPVDAGLYRLAYSIASLVFIPTAPLSQAIYPEIAREAARAEWHRFGRVLRRGSALAAAYVVPVAAAVGLLATPIVAFFYGAAFVPAVPALIVLLAGMGFANVFFWSRPALLALHRPDYPFKVNVGLAVLKVAAIFAVIPAFGYLGSAAVLALSYVAGVGLCVWKARQIVAGQRPASGPTNTMSPTAGLRA